MQRLLVTRLSAFGDVIHTIPAVVALREALGAEVSWVVERPYRELVELVAGVRAIPVSLKKWKNGGDLAAAIRATRGFDAAVDFQGLIKSAVLVRLSGAPLRFGFAKAAIREKQAAWFTNRHVEVDTAAHVIEQNLALASGVAGRTLALPAVDFSPYVEPLPGFEGKVVILPGAGRPEKLWPAERLGEVARRLGDVVVAWGPGERDMAERVGAPLAPPTSLRQLAYLLQHARLVIGADTGPLHLAAALGTAVLGLYGPTNPRRNGPYGQLQHCIDRYPTTRSMDSIGVDDVLRAVEEVHP